MARKKRALPINSPFLPAAKQESDLDAWRAWATSITAATVQYVSEGTVHVNGKDYSIITFSRTLVFDGDEWVGHLRDGEILPFEIEPDPEAPETRSDPKDRKAND